MVEFYCRVLGFQVSDRMSYPDDYPMREVVFIRCNSEHHVLSMFGLRNPSPLEGTTHVDRLGLHHLAFELGSFEDLRAAVRYLRAENISVRSVRHGGPGSQMRVYFWDPEYNVIELFWALDQIGWDGHPRRWVEMEEIDIETFDVEAWLDWKGPEFSPEAHEAHGAEDWVVVNPVFPPSGSAGTPAPPPDPGLV
jgi:catechol 2,3-dioxygenase-like lactoylglutathione lyase family enzyme